MTHLIRLCCLLSVLFLLPDLLSAQPSVSKPVKVIFDTDLGNDIDDTMALAMLHALQSRGEIEMLAITSTKDNAYVAPMISLVNTFYGRPEIPIGIADNKVTTDEGKYNRKVVEMTDANKLLCFPKNVDPTTALPDGVTLLRKTLAESPDESVVIIQVGFFSNLAKLLDTPGDDFSPLTGMELVVKKVQYVSLMAGSFDSKYHRETAEYNVIKDIPAALKLIRQWPTKLVFSGFEVGMALHYPAASMLQDFEYVQYHPVKEAYRFYRGLENNQPTWDLNSVLYVARPDRGYFTLSPPGTVTMTENGITNFTPDPNGKHFYQIVDEKQIAMVRETLIQLTSEPPKK